MKKVEYKTDKWEKRKNLLLEKGIGIPSNVQALKEKADSLWSNDYSKLNFVALSLVGAVEYNYCFCNKSDFIAIIHNILDYECICCQALNSGIELKEGPRRGIIGNMKSGYWGYFALSIEDERRFLQVVDKESMLFYLHNKSIISTDNRDSVFDMIKAISVQNSEDFNEALKTRIVQFRKLPLDYYLCVDIWSLGLIKYAEKRGMQVERNKYIEADLDFIGL